MKEETKMPAAAVTATGGEHCVRLALGSDVSIPRQRLRGKSGVSVPLIHRRQGVPESGPKPVVSCDVWRAMALDEIERLAALQVVFTADDVRQSIGDPPRWQQMGAALRTMAGRGVIIVVEVVRANRRSRNGGWLGKWIGVPDIHFGSSKPDVIDLRDGATHER